MLCCFRKRLDFNLSCIADRIKPFKQHTTIDWLKEQSLVLHDARVKLSHVLAAAENAGEKVSIPMQTDLANREYHFPFLR
jgi:hypothetical protein